MRLLEVSDSAKGRFIRNLFKTSHECIANMPVYSGRSVISDPMQAFISSNSSDPIERVLLDLFRRNLIACEGTYAQSARISLEICSLLHKSGIYDLSAVDDFVKKSFTDSVKTRLSRNDLKDQWISTVGESLIDSSWIDDIKIDSNVECKLTKGTKSQVSLHPGHLFRNVRLHDSFCNVGKIRESDCSVVLVDGNVESEGEIFSLVEKHKKSGSSCFIVAAGFSPSVSLYLLKNYIMGSFKVIPLICATQDDPIGVMVDLSCVTGAEVITSAKGDTVSGSHERCTSIIKNISATNSGVTFVPERDSDSSRARIQELQKVLGIATDSDARKYISDRISSLRGSMIRVSISEHDNSLSPGLIGRVDTFLRSLSPSVRMGLIEVGGKKYPLLSARESILAFSSFISCLRSMQVILEES